MNNIVIDARGKENAIEVILDNGYKDITPDIDFYSWDKKYEKDKEIYMFGGWSGWNPKEGCFKSINMIKVHES